MFLYKWYLIGRIQRNIIPDTRICEKCYEMAKYPGFIIYWSGTETSDFELCIREGHEHFNKCDFPDSCGCRLVIDVKYEHE